MVADRPSQSESTSVMAIGELQLETGFSFEKVDDYVKNFALNSSVFRYGLFENIELRLGVSYLKTDVELDGGDINESGLGPLKIGTKFFLKEEDEGFPALAFLSTLSIPNTGSSAFENENLGAEFRLNADHTVNDVMALGFNVGVLWSGIENEDYAVGLYTAVVDLSLSEQISMFAELYGFFPGEGKNDHRWDGGIVYTVNDNLKIDFSGGIGLSKVSPDFFIGMGLAIRMP